MPKHGYRFTADVQASPVSVDLGPSVGRDQDDGARSRVLVIAAACAVLVLVVGALALRRAEESTDDVALAVTPITTYPGLEIHPGLSPDGSQIAFAWDGVPTKDLDIYVQLIGRGNPMPLTSDPRPEFSPAWSPDGRHIVFCRASAAPREVPLSGSSPHSAEIIVVQAQGGAERVIARASESWAPDCGARPTLSWFPSSDAIASVGYAIPRVTGRAAAIYVVPLDGAPPRQLTSPPPASWGDALPVVSSDGHSLAFTRSPHQYWVGAVIHTMPLTSDKAPAGDPEPLLRASLPEQASVDALGWARGREEVLFSRQGVLWTVLVAGSRVPRLIATPGHRPGTFSISRAGERLAFSAGSFDLDIWRIPGPAGRGDDAPSAEGQPFIATTMLDSNPQYSADGRRIAFTSARSGALQIWVADADGSNAVQVTRSVEWNGTPRWSPDGRHLAYDAVEAGKGDIYVIPAGGGAARRVTPEDSHEHVPSWSRDGRWIYFESDRTGEFQLWKSEFPTGSTVQVTTAGGAAAFESPDGRLVYYGKRGQAGIWRRPVTGGEEEQVTARGHAMFWGTYDKGACWTEPQAEEVTVECLDFESARVSIVRRFPNGGRVRATGPSFAVSPRGEWILYSRVAREDADLMLVDRFGAVRRR